METLDHLRVTRLIVLLEHPYHLPEEDSESWLRSEAAHLAYIRAIQRIDMSRLARPSQHFAQDWHWLLEIYLRQDEDPQRAFNEPSFIDLLADFRLLGMRPSVVVVQNTAVIAGAD